MKRIKVLLVDDSELILESEKSFLNRGDYDISTANDGRQALQLIKDFRPDVIFLDLHLPDISGDKICKAIKDNAVFRETRVIIATADTRPEVQELCRQVGADELLRKPVRQSEFHAAMVKVLGITARKQPRVPTDISCIADDGSKGHVCRILNLSVLGVYIAIEPVADIGQNFELTFGVPPMEDPVFVKGVVKWNSNTAEKELPPGAGISFVDLPVDIEDLIDDYVKSRTA